MPFNNKTSDTGLEVRIYAYGCTPKREAIDPLVVQLRLATRYYNKLVECRRRQLTGEKDALHSLSPALVAVEDEIEKKKEEVWDILDEVIKEHPVLKRRLTWSPRSSRRTPRLESSGLRTIRCGINSKLSRRSCRICITDPLPFANLSTRMVASSKSALDSSAYSTRSANRLARKLERQTRTA